jgi:hypothetical protein
MRERIGVRWENGILRARILTATWKKPADGSTHWSCRKLAALLGVSKDVVRRVATLLGYPIGGTLAKCDPFGIPSTSHWTGAAIIVQY